MNQKEKLVNKLKCIR